MKKITIYLAIFMALLCTSTVHAIQTPSYFVNETFDGLSALPTGWTTSRSPYGNTGTIASTITSDKLQFLSASASGSRGGAVNIPNSGAEQTVYLDFDWICNTPLGTSKNSASLIFHDNTNPAAPKDILGFYLGPWGETDAIHCWNMDLTTAAYIGSMQTYPSFNKAGATNAETTILNNSTQLGNGGGAAFSSIATYNIKATLDFSTKKVSYLKITLLSDNSFVEKTNLPFIDNTATTVGEISFSATKSSNAGNGGNSGWTTQLDNLKVYKMIEASVAKVTINYVDQANSPIKSVELLDKIVGSTYTASTTDKETFVLDGFYYSYDVVNTTADNVEILNDGTSVITLKFSKATETAGPYTWTGATSNWNDFDMNFTTTGSNTIAYQNGNSVIFDATAANKVVTLTKDFHLGSNNITVTADGYSFDGTGGINGSGSFIFNLGTTGLASINQKNYQSGGIVINSGDVTILNQLSGTTYTLGDAAKLTLQTSADFSKSVTTTGTSATIKTISNVFYNPTITGTASNINLVLGVSGNITGGVNWSSKFLSIMPANAQVNITTDQLTAGYGVASTSLSSNKVNLGDNIRLLYNYNPSAGGTTVIYIGELTGSSTASVEGGWVNAADRGLNYEIGSLNTDATYNGVFKNYGTILSAPLNISKKGTGMWTLTAANPEWILGTLNIDEGKVIMNGSISSSTVTAKVASGATLSGTGTIAGATTVNGTLEGKLNFGSNLTLAGTTKVTVSGFEAGEFDVVKVTGTVNLGGVLEIAVSASAPANGTSIKIIDAAVYAGDFTQPITAPTGYTFDKATGMLTYSNTTSVDNAANSNLKVYTANNKAIIEGINAGEGYVIYNTLGAIVKSGVATSSKVEVKLANSAIYIVKVGKNVFKISK